MNNIKNIQNLFIFLNIFLILNSTGCNKKYIEPSSPKILYEEAMKNYKEKKFKKSRELFQKFIFKFPELKEAEEAQFYIGETYFEQKKYQEALGEYEMYIQMYPGGKRFEEAIFKKLLCQYMLSPPYYKDQEKTIKTITKLNTYIEKNGPYSDSVKVLLNNLKAKIAHKYYEAARFYFKMKFYESSIIYLDVVIKDYPITPWYEKALFIKYEIFKKEGKMEEANKILDTLKSLNSKEAIKIINKL